MSENLAVVRRAFDAFHSGDVDGAVAVSVSDVEWDASRAAPDGSVYRGMQEIRAAWSGFQGAWTTHRVTIERAVEVGDRVLLLYHEYGRGKGTGVEVEMKSADTYTVRAGRVARVVSYSNPAMALRDAGLEAD